MNRSLHSIKASAGFTLIELMITFTILAILTVIGVSLSSVWIDRANVDSASASLKTAISQARVVALRNSYNIPSTAIATATCIDTTNKAINVYQLSSGSTTACATTNTVLKSLNYSNGVTFKQSSTSITGNCFAFNSNGMVASATSSTCATDLNNITVGKNNDSTPINII